MTMGRRLVVVIAALSLAVPILRSALSSALVTRGDALFYMHDTRASDKYALALQLDRNNVTAADRYVFTAFLSREPHELEKAIRIASAVLQADPDEAAVRMDRALCLQLLKRYPQAERDFEEVGRQLSDVRALAMAASDARLNGDTTKARRLLLAAAHLDPRYVPVRIALERNR